MDSFWVVNKSRSSTHLRRIVKERGTVHRQRGYWLLKPRRIPWSLVDLQRSLIKVRPWIFGRRRALKLISGAFAGALSQSQQQQQTGYPGQPPPPPPGVPVYQPPLQQQPSYPPPPPQGYQAPTNGYPAYPPPPPGFPVANGAPAYGYPPQGQGAPPPPPIRMGFDGQ